MFMSLCSTKYDVMKPYQFNKAPRHGVLLGSGGIAPRTLNSALDEGELSASRHGRFTPREGAPGSRWIGTRVGIWAGLDTEGEKEIPSVSLLGIEPRLSSL
jgi:hypothetical protein